MFFWMSLADSCDGFMFMDDKFENSRVIKEKLKELNCNLAPFNTRKNQDRGKPKTDIIWME